jgi:MFS family permease
MGGTIADSHYGWRAGFTWFGLTGIAYALVLSFALPDRSREAGWQTHKAPSVGAVAALGSLLGTFSFLLLVLYFTLPAMPGWIVKNWMPSVLADKFALKQGAAGISATLWVTLASLAGALFGGGLADRWMRSTARGRIYTSAIGMVLLVPAVFFIDSAPTLAMAIGLLILFGFGWGLFDTNNMPILCQIVPPEYRATGYGLMNLISVSAGAWATTKMGALRDGGGALPSVMFRWCALATLCSVGLVLLIRPKGTLTSKTT